ncbi:protein FAM192A [Lingula anatina]|uniref:Protein FAM192A n=1 Tax=Lingula anatina TaxID=7574 RepID=A0A1S3JKD9_LINAN|nr:protein FAM192A [Lingula anatina]|eukprot:XP_013410838.1 protein FAM192A [Lingula anatina]
MSGKDSDLPVAFKKFVSEDEIEEQKKRRQEEWEKVRTADQPIEAPEEDYDHRSLFERLQEQKQKKDDEYNEKYKLSNMVKGLEDDEAQFLDFVSVKQEQIMRAREKENEEALEEYKNAVMNLATTSAAAKKDDIKEKTKTKNNHANLQKVTVTVVSRSSEEEKVEKTIGSRSSCDTVDFTEANSNNEDSTKKTKIANAEGSAGDSKNQPNTNGAQTATLGQSKRALQQGKPQVAKVIGILPGMGYYTDSSDSEDSSASENDDRLDEDVSTVSKIKGTVKSCEQTSSGGQNH